MDDKADLCTSVHNDSDWSRDVPEPSLSVFQSIFRQCRGAQEKQYLEKLGALIRADYGADQILIGIIDAERDRINTVHVHGVKVGLDSIAHDLQETLFFGPRSGYAVGYSKHLQKMFPDDDLFAEWGSEAYFGFPLLDAQDEVIGLVAILFNREINDFTPLLSLMSVVGGRASAECARIIAKDDEERRSLQLHAANQLTRIGYWSTYFEDRVVKWNSTLSEILGLPPTTTTVSESYFRDHAHPDDMPRILRDGTQSVKEARLGKPSVYRYFLPDGKMIWVQVTYAGIENRHGRTFVHGTLLDVTSTMQVREDLIKAKQEAEAASRTKSLFLANISHELRTPLNAIIGFGEALEMQIFGELNDRNLEYTRMITKSARHLLSIINDLLDMTKVEQGQMDLNVESFDLRHVIEEAIKTIGPMAEESNATFKFSAYKPAIVVSDAVRSQQCILNIISNAVKYAPNGMIKIALARSKQRIRVRIQDFGKGISPKDIDRIMQPFDQGAELTDIYARARQGTGLGLPLARNLMKLMGGDLKMTSQLGKGTTVTLSFPAAS